MARAGSGGRPHHAPETRGSEARDAAAYVAALVHDLREIARRHNLSTLAYLLDMARLEAESTARSGSEEQAG
ncbi:MAG: hypothetical protein ABW275_09835 [Hansschlegelia sp.]